MLAFKSGLSAQTLVQLLVFSLLVAILVFFNLSSIKAFYFEDQITYTGLVINGLILALFVVGMIRVVYLLFYYWREEKSIARFLKNLQQEAANMAQGVNPRSLILQRYQTLQDINRQKATINQSALASIMVAHESTRLSLVRFISNILILCGVFGTIVSLSIALLGASNLLESNTDISGMSNVIHGMSTALSTTTTAIVCYLFFGYFFQRLSDIQTHVFSAIELISTQYIIPSLNHQSDNIMSHLTELVSSLSQTAVGMQTVQQQLLKTSQQAETLMSQYDERIQTLTDNVAAITILLQQGFRLPESSLKSLQAREEDTSTDTRPPHALYKPSKPQQ